MTHGRPIERNRTDGAAPGEAGCLSGLAGAGSAPDIGAQARGVVAATEGADQRASVIVAMRTGRGLNSREHWRARARRVKAEREAVAWALIAQKPSRPVPPCVVTLTRLAPSNGLDDDNLAGSLKAVRDAVAEWIGVDDRSPLVRYQYGQRRSKRGFWAVEMAFA